MHKYILIFLLTAALSAQSQESSFEYNGDLGFFNSGISSQLLSQSYGFLSADEKNNIIDNLQLENHLAFEANGEFKYQDKKGWGLSLSNRIGTYATYPKSLVELILLGNTPFKGESLKLDPLKLTAFNYSQIDFSYQWSKKINTSVGLLLGHQFLNLNVNDARFYTDPQAAFINYQVDFEAHYTDTNMFNKPFSNNGYGAAFGISYKDSINKGDIEVSISDLGFIKWNDKTTNMHIENQYQFEGVNVDDFISFNDSIIRDEIDSVKASLESNLKESYTWRLPSRLRLCINHPLNSSIIQAYTLSIEHRMDLYNVPRISLDVHKIAQKHLFSLGYHIGGIERQGFQMSYSYKGKKTHWQLYTKQANAIIPSTNYGVHLGIGIKRVFSSSK